MTEVKRIAALPRIEVVCYAVGAALVLIGIAHLGVAATSNRAWEGPLSWRKPVTFGLSFGTTLATVTWTSSYLTISRRLRAALLGVFAVDCVVEVAGITVQAWRDVPSHFNTSTPANTAVAMTLAAGGFVLVVVLGRLAIAAFRGQVAGGPALLLALRAGYAFLLAGLGAGVAMIARGTALARTGHPSEAYAEGGFLKLFHGVTIHAVLVLPALAVLLASRTPATQGQILRLVRVGVAAYAAVGAAVLAYSLVRL